MGSSWSPGLSDTLAVENRIDVQHVGCLWPLNDSRKVVSSRRDLTTDNGAHHVQAPANSAISFPANSAFTLEWDLTNRADVVWLLGEFPVVQSWPRVLSSEVEMFQYKSIHSKHNRQLCIRCRTGNRQRHITTACLAESYYSPPLWRRGTCKCKPSHLAATTTGSGARFVVGRKVAFVRGQAGSVTAVARCEGDPRFDYSSVEVLLSLQSLRITEWLKLIYMLFISKNIYCDIEEESIASVI